MGIHILVGFNPLVHKRGVIIAGSGAVPCLTGVFEIAYMMVAYNKIASEPVESEIIRARAAGGAVHIAVSGGFVVCPFCNEVFPKQSRRERGSGIEGVAAAERAAYFSAWQIRRLFGG